SDLPTTTGLAHKLAFDLASVADRFTVSHLRLADVGFNVELALHAVDQNIQVQLAHTTNDGLTGLFVRAHTERRIFLGQFAQSNAHLLLVGFGLRLDGNVNHRLGEVHTLANDLLVQVAMSVTSGDVFQTEQGSNVNGAQLFDLGTVVGLHLIRSADALVLELDLVEHGEARNKDTGVQLK